MKTDFLVKEKTKTDCLLINAEFICSTLAVESSIRINCLCIMSDVHMQFGGAFWRLPKDNL